MGLQPERRHLSVDEYLAGELVSEVRHEYIDGEVYAMVGTSDRHNLIAGNLHAALHPHVRGTNCQLFMSDMKVRLRVTGADTFYYPDLLVSCDPGDRETYFRTRPCLLVEVLSDSTERIDRREKLLAYTQIDSLQEYLLVSQERPEVEIHRRRDDWRGTIHTEGSIILEFVGIEIPLEQVYEEVPLP